ncbi:GNAT family N-acetyltransferase [Atopobiaceae bacterium 24-176]
MEIREARASDVDRMLKLLAQVNRVHAEGRPDLFRLGTKYAADELAAILEDPDRPVFVADDEGHVTGYCFCEVQRVEGDSIRRDAVTLYIDDLCVDESVRGRGVGRALYNRAVDWARQRGFFDVTLNVWECNPGARAFYEALGMTPMKTTMEQVL